MDPEQGLFVILENLAVKLYIIFLAALAGVLCPKRMDVIHQGRTFFDFQPYRLTWTSIEPEDSAALRPYTQPDAFYALRRALADYLDGKYSLLHVLGTQDGVYGMSAAGRGAGFYADGSYTYGTAVLHPEKSVDAEFKDTFQRIAKNTNRFEYGETPEKFLFPLVLIS